MIGQMMRDTCLYVFISMNEDDRKGMIFLTGIKNPEITQYFRILILHRISTLILHCR